MLPNPWFSPPAVQYPARLNPPPGPSPARYPWRCTYCHAEADGTDMLCSACRREISAPPRQAILGRQRGVRGRRGRRGAWPTAQNYEFAEPELNQPDPVWHPGGGLRIGGRYRPGSGRYHHPWRPDEEYGHGGGRWYEDRWYPGGGHYEFNPSDMHGRWYGLNPSDMHGRWYGLNPPNPYHRGRYYPERPLPGMWHPSLEEEEEREEAERLQHSLAAIGGYELNPSDLYGRWYGLNPGCREVDLPAGRGTALDCWHTNPELGYNPTEYPTPLARRVAERIARGPGTERAIWDDVDAVVRHGENPAAARKLAEADDAVMIRGRQVPVTYSKGGKYHHVRVADPDEFERIRTKALSGPKGIKARIGVFQGRGPRGGKTEVQSYLFDAKKYTPEDVVRWIEGHRTPEPLLMDVSPASTTERRMAVWPEKPARKRKKKAKVKKKAAKRKKSTKKKSTKKSTKKKSTKKAGTKKRRKKKAANPKKKRSRKVPPASKRCVVVVSGGRRCKGYRKTGSEKCPLHAAGIARAPKQNGRKRRKAG